MLVKYAYSAADLIIAQTDEMKTDLIEWYKIKKIDKVHVVFNPVDVDLIEEKIKERSPFLPNTVNYVGVGSVSKIKGFDLLVHAFEAVVKSNSSSHLYIIGRITDQTLVDDAMKLPYSDHIHFIGFSDNPYIYISNCDCFVLSSRTEGLPNVMLEAMYLQKPIVATRCIPFVEKAIISGVNGFVIDKDNVSELKYALCEIIKIKTLVQFNLKKDSLVTLFEYFWKRDH
jgi:glycosyltransferase involved in cell wall biosynthesis